MAKPIFILKLSKSFVGEDISKITHDLGIMLDDYHVLTTTTFKKETTYECLNDCKGLLDIDIEKLINDLKHG